MSNTTAIRAFPHVAGETRRYKAKPTELNPLAARVMCASGAFSGESTAAPFRFGRFLGALGFVLVAATLAFADDGIRVVERATNAEVQLIRAEDSGVRAGEQPATNASVPSSQLDAQDRFEIERMFRKNAAAGEVGRPAGRSAAR